MKLFLALFLFFLTLSAPAQVPTVKLVFDMMGTAKKEYAKRDSIMLRAGYKRVAPVPYVRWSALTYEYQPVNDSAYTSDKSTVHFSIDNTSAFFEYRTTSTAHYQLLFNSLLGIGFKPDTLDDDDDIVVLHNALRFASAEVFVKTRTTKQGVATYCISVWNEW